MEFPACEDCTRAQIKATSMVECVCRGRVLPFFSPPLPPLLPAGCVCLDHVLPDGRGACVLATSLHPFLYLPSRPLPAGCVRLDHVLRGACVPATSCRPCLPLCPSLSPPLLPVVLPPVAGGVRVPRPRPARLAGCVCLGHVLPFLFFSLCVCFCFLSPLSLPVFSSPLLPAGCVCLGHVLPDGRGACALATSCCSLLFFFFFCFSPVCSSSLLLWRGACALTTSCPLGGVRASWPRPSIPSSTSPSVAGGVRAPRPRPEGCVCPGHVLPSLSPSLSFFVPSSVARRSPSLCCWRGACAPTTSCPFGGVRVSWPRPAFPFFSLCVCVFVFCPLSLYLSSPPLCCRRGACALATSCPMGGVRVPWPRPAVPSVFLSSRRSGPSRCRSRRRCCWRRDRLSKHSFLS